MLVRLIASLANRFGIVVTQKAMAQTIPVIGAVGGGLIVLFSLGHLVRLALGRDMRTDEIQ